MGLISNETYDYWGISYGKIRKRTTEDDPNAVKRTVENDDGTKKVVYELVNKGLSGIIEGVEIRKGNFGSQLYIEISDGIDRFFLQVGWETPYSRTFLERLPGVDITKEVSIIPYSFEDKSNKRSGITLYQDGVKIPNYYKEYNEDFTSSKHLHGYPAGKDGMDSDDWKIVGIQQMKFLKEKVVDAFPFIDKEEVRDSRIANSDDKKSDLPF